MYGINTVETQDSTTQNIFNSSMITLHSNQFMNLGLTVILSYWHLTERSSFYFSVCCLSKKYLKTLLSLQKENCFSLKQRTSVTRNATQPTERGLFGFFNLKAARLSRHPQEAHTGILSGLSHAKLSKGWRFKAISFLTIFAHIFCLINIENNAGKD